jgi:hypothetical protein
VNLLAGVYGVKNCGIGMKVMLRKCVEEATMSYSFEFSEGYSWTLGGKMPGLSCACASTRTPPLYRILKCIHVSVSVVLLIQAEFCANPVSALTESPIHP